MWKYILLMYLGRCHLNCNWPTGLIDAPSCYHPIFVNQIDKYKKSTTKRHYFTLNLLKYIYFRFHWLIKSYDFIYLKVQNTFLHVKNPPSFNNPTCSTHLHSPLSLSCVDTTPTVSVKQIWLLAILPTWEKQNSHHERELNNGTFSTMWKFPYTYFSIISNGVN